MIRTHNAVVIERDRAMQVLAQMKALEAKRKKDMQTVMINSKTIISATKTALKEKMAQMRNSSFKPSSDTPVKESKHRKQRREQFWAVFGGADTMVYRELTKKLREDHGAHPDKVTRMVRAGVRDGDLVMVDDDPKTYKLIRK